MKKRIMLQGTGSDVGKSVLATALCRIFTQDGYRVVPFKSQNMALNSYVTPDGKEIGRAQGVQAEACGVDATADMNPILIKPSGSMRSQIVVRGEPLTSMEARVYQDFTEQAWEMVKESYRRLEAQADLVIIEGAGSPVEMNLRDREIVNMRVARWLQAPVILVADIDRGGVFAQIVGTLELLEPEERDLVVGIVINKFRGDPSLVASGLQWLEERTGKPVLGLIPHLPELDLEAEDSVALDTRSRWTTGDMKNRLQLAVIRHPHIANFSDLDALEKEPDVHLYYVQNADALGNPDAIILPGSKNVPEDWLHWVRTGLAYTIKGHAKRGTIIVGICGGYQMLGREMADPDGIESDHPQVTGLGLFPLQTRFLTRKRTLRVQGQVIAKDVWPTLSGLKVTGYEIHMGITTRLSEEHPGSPLFRLAAAGEDFREEGWISPDGRQWGTYLHGVFDNDHFRRGWLNLLRAEKGWPPLESTYRYQEKREEAFERLAAHVRQHLDLDRLKQVLGWEKTVQPPGR